MLHYLGVSKDSGRSILDELQLSDRLFAKTHEDTVAVIYPAENKSVPIFSVTHSRKNPFILAMS